MSTYDGEKSLLSKIVTWVVAALVALALIKLAFWVFGAALGIGAWLLFTVGPILLVGWIVVKVFRFFTRRSDGYDAT
jgi:hypothetical protein